MKKSEFKNKLKENNESARLFFKLNIISLIIFYIMIIAMVIFHFSNLVTLGVCLIIDVLILIFIATPLIALNIKNDIEVNEIYKNYKNSKDFFKYKDKNKFLKFIIVLELIIMLVCGGLITWNIIDGKLDNLEVLNDGMTVITNKGNKINMKYVEVDNLSIKLPDYFEVMDEELLVLKYPSEKRPTLVYTNDDISINAAFNLNGASLNSMSILEYINSMKTLFEKLGIEVDSDSFEIDGKKLYSLKMITGSINANIYNHMILFEENGELKLISFNCIEKDMDEWKEVFSFMSNSIKFK